MLKRIVVALLTIALFVSLIPTTVFAASSKNLRIAMDEATSIEFNSNNVSVKSYDKNIISVKKLKTASNISKFEVAPKNSGETLLTFNNGFSYKVEVIECIEVGEKVSFYVGFPDKLTRKVSSKEIISTNISLYNSDTYQIDITGKKAGIASVNLYNRYNTLVGKITVKVKEKVLPTYTVSAVAGEYFGFKIKESCNKVKNNNKNLLSFEKIGKDIVCQACKSGKGKIYLYKGNKKVAMLDVTVTEAKIAGINNLKVGTGAQFYLYDSETSKKLNTTNVIWGSTNTNVVTVDNEGNVVATGKGNAILVVSTSSDNTPIATYNVFVY